MNDLNSFERELACVSDSIKSYAYFRSQQHFLQTDHVSSIKALLSHFVSANSDSLSADLCQQLNSIVTNDLKSNYFYLNLLTCSQGLSSSKLDSTQLFNNMAVNHFNLKKFTISALYMQKALNKFAENSKQTSVFIHFNSI